MWPQVPLLLVFSGRVVVMLAKAERWECVVGSDYARRRGAGVDPRKDRNKREWDVLELDEWMSPPNPARTASGFPGA